MLQLGELAALDSPSRERDGLPLMLPVDVIAEDPEQPRHEFETNALQELAETIRERGVRQPVSVRPDLSQAGKWILNFGARRLRAARIAGLAEIPAFVDTTADSYDQMIENEHRAPLTPMELALFVQKRLAVGDSRAEIARRLGKSRQYVTLASALIEAPDWLLNAYREGKCRGMNELYELRRLHGVFEGDVEAWVDRQEAVTRDGLASLRVNLENRHQRSPSQVAGRPLPVAPLPSEREQATAGARSTRQRVHVELDGQDYVLVLSIAPKQQGQMYVRPLAGGPRRLASASDLTLRGFVGG